MPIGQDEDIRIYELPEAQELTSGMKVAVDSETDGTKSFDLSNLAGKVDEPETAPEAGQVLTFDGTENTWANPPEGVYVINYSEVSSYDDIDVERATTQPTYIKVDSDQTITIRPEYTNQFTVNIANGTLLRLIEIKSNAWATFTTEQVGSYPGTPNNSGFGASCHLDLMLKICRSEVSETTKVWAASGDIEDGRNLFLGEEPKPCTFYYSNGRGTYITSGSLYEKYTGMSTSVQITDAAGNYRRNLLMPAEIQSHDFSSDTTPEQIQFMGWGATSNRAGYRTISEVPASTSQDEGKVLTVDSNGAAGWTAPTVRVFTGEYNPDADPADYSGLPDQADVLAAIDAGKDVVLMLKPASSAPYFAYRLYQKFQYSNLFLRADLLQRQGNIMYRDYVMMSYAGPDNPWTWSGGKSDVSYTAEFRYWNASKPSLSDMQAACDSGKAVFMVLGEDVRVGGTSYAPRTYTLVKGTIMPLVYDAGRKGASDNSLEFNCFGHFGSSGETGNASGLVMVEAIVKNGSGGDEWEWNIRFDESLGGIGNWNDSIIKQYTTFRGSMVQLILNGRTLGLLPATAASMLEYAGMAPVNQRGQAICWGANNSEVGYVNMPRFNSVNGPFNVNGGTSFMDVDFIEIDNLSKFVALYLNNIKSDNDTHEDRCIFTPYAFAQPWQPNTSYTADSSVVWVNGQAYLCNTTHTSGGTWDATEQANWTAKNWLQYVQDKIGAVKNGGALTDAASVNVPNNSLSTLSTAKATLTLNVNVDSGEVPNFAVEITPSVDVTLTVTKTVGNTTTTLNPSVSGGNSLTTGKLYQVTCVGSCWTLAEFTVPTP